MILENINSPKDLKDLELREIKHLAGEIRDFMIKNLSETGGHFASNLGVVELTLMLHYIFDSPKDKLIFDVGHQTYTHKIITGRKDKFNTIRQFNGLSGFPKRSESEHDIVEVGHASTSLSIALGIDRAQLHFEKDGRVIAIIGDGSMTGGLALEAINNSINIPNNLIMIVNNNDMSIGNNIGAIAKYFNRTISDPKIQAFSEGVEYLASKVPIVGDQAQDVIKRIEASLKAFISPGVVLRELGFKYLGPIDGHNIEELNETLKFAKSINYRVLIQVNTKKGKGYKFSEKNPGSYHSVGSFNIETGKSQVYKKQMTYSEAFSNIMVRLREKDDRIIAISAAMCNGTGLDEFSKKYPDSFYDVGIAEAHAIDFSVGLAIGGLKPIAAIYSTFMQRAYDQVIHDAALMNLPVIIAMDRAGIVPGDGETHQGVFDLVFLRTVPNMSIFAPVLEKDFESTLELATSLDSPVAIRYPKDNIPDSDPEIIPDKVELGKSHIIKEGKSGVVFSFGRILHDVYEAVKVAEKNDGLDLTVVNLVSLKPLDIESITRLAKKYGRVMVIEEGTKMGGIGSAVLEVLSDNDIFIPTQILGIQDEFLEVGTRAELLKVCGLDFDSIKEKIINFFKK